jgi:hypothetical protein
MASLLVSNSGICGRSMKPKRASARQKFGATCSIVMRLRDATHRTDWISTRSTNRCYSGDAVPGLPDQRRILSALANVAARGSAANPRRFGQIRSLLHRRRATAYGDKIPGAEIHILDAGHFALDEATDEIASLVRK